jgi:hypothetical protein
MDYGAVSQAIRRFGSRLEREPDLRREVSRIEAKMLNV